MRLSALAARERRIANNVAESLPRHTHTHKINQSVTPKVGQVVPGLFFPFPSSFPSRAKKNPPGTAKEWNILPYLSASCASKTCRLVWSRMTLILTKQPMSSFLARYRFILGRNNDAIFAMRRWSGVGRRVLSSSSSSSLGRAKKAQDVGDLRSRSSGSAAGSLLSGFIFSQRHRPSATGDVQLVCGYLPKVWQVCSHASIGLVQMSKHFYSRRVALTETTTLINT